jgi:deazaflavin-dependent oxidoreductase (nitroreductase family)
MSGVNDYNRSIIDEFRAGGGKLGGSFENMNLLLLHTTGAKSGQERVNPLAYQPLGDEWAIFGSKRGAPTHPDWYHNLVANPEVTIEVGSETLPVTARVLEGEEREKVWTRQKESSPVFAEYETNTSREIPVIVLRRR